MDRKVEDSLTDEAKSLSLAENAERSPAVVTSDAALLRYGVVRVRLDYANHCKDKTTTAASQPLLDTAYWATELSQVTPEILTAQGDGEYAFYRNILHEKDFPFERILLESSIGEAILRHFPVSSLQDELRLDDAFCVHYNTSQEDSSGAKHMDPSDITVNLCLEATDELEGSQVMFHGHETLDNVPSVSKDGDDSDSTTFRFLVPQTAGTATIHWGHHPHETRALRQGRRTNVILTYCYTDPGRSDVATRTCYS